MSTVIRFHAYGGPDVLQVEDRSVGAPGPGQVRLHHDAIGVNFIDTIFRQGIYPVALPSVPGVEGAGVIEAVGPGVEAFAVGDRVAYFLAPGSYAADRLIEAEAVVKLPDDITTEQAATVLTKGLTAWTALNGFHRLQAGETILVQGASSSVGLLLARWAKARGATVIGTAGAGKRDALRADVHHALVSSDADLAAQIRQIAPQGVDVVYEFVGKATFAASQASVRDGGTIVNIGAASGAPEIDAPSLTARGVKVLGGPMAQHLQGDAREQATRAVFDALRSGVFGQIDVTRYPLSAAATAHADIAARSRSGSAILVP
ncbi:quinone oxidoreductase family protein [Variovorax boronicumulans]